MVTLDGEGAESAYAREKGVSNHIGSGQSPNTERPRYVKGVLFNGWAVWYTPHGNFRAALWLIIIPASQRGPHRGRRNNIITMRVGDLCRQDADTEREGEMG